MNNILHFDFKAIAIPIRHVLLDFAQNNFLLWSCFALIRDKQNTNKMQLKSHDMRASIPPPVHFT